MPNLKITRIEIQGFRAFGNQVQVAEFKGPLSLIWGSNSQGKTSCAEAIEFLFTGQTVRREFVASATREFAGSLRNAHLPAKVPVFVRAEFQVASGTKYLVERTLVSDYSGRDQCVSELKIDGKIASDITQIGVKLSERPLQVPILMQHTLRYVVSVEPQQRSDYFKALLEVADLDLIRKAVTQAIEAFKIPSNSHLEKLDRLLTTESMRESLKPLEAGYPSLDETKNALLIILGQFINDNQPLPVSLDDRLVHVEAMLEEKRKQTFPIHGFNAKSPQQRIEISEEEWAILNELAKLNSELDQEATRLASLFQAVIQMPKIRDAHEPIDCPVCETQKALTPTRVTVIKEQLKKTALHRSTVTKAESILSKLNINHDQFHGGIQSSLPMFMTWSSEQCEKVGFSNDKIKSLLDEGAYDLVEKWQTQTKELKNAYNTMLPLLKTLKASLATLTTSTINSKCLVTLKEQVLKVSVTAKDYQVHHGQYLPVGSNLKQQLQSKIDSFSNTQGWQDAIDLAKSPGLLRDAIFERRAHQKVVTEMENALREINDASTAVFDEKFSKLGNDIVYWWELLRPAETTVFDGVQRGGTGKRFIDLKAKLFQDRNDPSSSVLRDAVAVFSDSQLNCLGLAAFLARAMREQNGFLLLDDPVPASDEEHRMMFVNQVLEELLNRSVQVILFTHDQSVAKSIQERYHHRSPDSFLITLGDPRAGAQIENHSDTLKALIARAVPYVRNANPQIRKQHAVGPLRDAGERFCKLMLIQDCKNKGDTSVNLESYSGKTLGDLVPKVEPLLTKDASHPGKLRMVGRILNPGSHDDNIPDASALTGCLGDLEKMARDYLV